jgi:hypothetical protein
MRLCIAASVALFAGACGLAQAQTSLAVPPAPPIVASPLTPPAPQADMPPPPPGLVQTPFPPSSPVPPAPPSSPAPPAAGAEAAPPAAPPNTDTGTGTSTGTNTGIAASNPAAPATPPATDTVPVAPNTWVPGKTATIGVLDKVDGSIYQISIPVGGQQNVGDLQVSVQACVNRPPGQLPDAAIFLSVQSPTDDTDSPLYKGWMVRSTPGATVVGDAGETFRVVDCS